MEKLLYTPAQVAEMLGISQSKVYYLIADGEIPSVRIGTSRRVTAEALKHFVQQLSEISDRPKEQAL